MLSNFFKSKPVIEQSSKEFILDTFAWCYENLDGDFFQHNSELILPNNSFYPGSMTSAKAMAEAIFTNTIEYSGLSAWPIKLVEVNSYIKKPMPQLLFSSSLRGENCAPSWYDANATNSTVPLTQGPTIDIAYHSSQLNQPQDLIAYLVQQQANILVKQNRIHPPGDKESLPMSIDLIGCFMGFGVIFSNTAYQFKGGCGSCNNRNLNRQSALPELETVYALALFCVIKGYETKQVKKELKSHLYKAFSKAHKEILHDLEQNDNPLQALITNKP